MARFKCTAAGCTVITDRRRAPAGCPTSHRCEFEEWDGVEPQPAPPPPPPVAVLPALHVEIGARTWPVTGTVALGRNGDVDPESFREHLAVSRQHCQLVLEGETWMLVALSSSSPTALDSRVIPAGMRMALSRPAHTLLLGGTMRITLRLEGAPSAEADPFTGALDEFLKGDA